MTTAATPRLALRDLPELDMRVGLHGSAAQAELGGSVCFGLAIATITATQMPQVADPAR